MNANINMLDLILSGHHLSNLSLHFYSAPVLTVMSISSPDFQDAWVCVHAARVLDSLRSAPWC